MDTSKISISGVKRRVLDKPMEAAGIADNMEEIEYMIPRKEPMAYSIQDMLHSKMYREQRLLFFLPCPLQACLIFDDYPQVFCK